MTTQFLCDILWAAPKRGILVSDQVESQEAIAIQVGRFLVAEGFVPARSSRVALHTLEFRECLGVLSDHAVRQDSWFFGLIKKHPRRAYLGLLWFWGAVGVKTSNWVFEVHGEENMELAENLARKLASEFGVEVTVYLASEQVNYERFSWED